MQPMQPKQSRTKSELGTIVIEKEVVARIAGLAAMECYGVVGMAAKNIRDGFVHMLKIESLSKGVRVEFLPDGGMKVGLHIIVDYGTNLAAIGTTLQENVRYAVETAIGEKVREVNVFIEGIRTE